MYAQESYSVFFFSLSKCITENLIYLMVPIVQL